MSVFVDVKRSAKRFYHKHPKLTVYGGIGAGVALFSGIVYAATRPAKPSPLSSLITNASQFIPYSRTIKGSIELAALTKRLEAMTDVLASGNVVFVSPGAFKQIFTHQGVKVLDLIPQMFYDGHGKFTMDEVGNHSHCQTWNAEVIGLGYDWIGYYYNQIYREPDIIKTCGVDLQCDPKDNGKQVHYAGNAVPAYTEPNVPNPKFVELAQAAMTAAINDAMTNANFGQALTDLDKKFGIKLPFALPADMTSLLMIPVPPWLKDILAKFARDMAAQNKKPLPTTDSDGKPLSPQAASLLQASAGAMMVGALVDMFESHDAKTNPCIKEVDAGLVFEMFMATIGTVLSLALGPALSGVSVVIKFASTVNKLAELSK